MLLKLRACLLSLPLLVVNAEQSQVMHSSDRRRREARLSQQALANIEQVLAKTDLQEHNSISWGGCKDLNAGCWHDGNCCGEMECLGLNPFDAKCGNTPGHVDDYCDIIYTCDSDLACIEGLCTEDADILDRGNYEGSN